MDPWLQAASERIASTLSGTPADYDLSDLDIATLLDLAKVAAHDSVRTNAPLVAYLTGLAVGRSGGMSLAEVASAAKGPQRSEA